METRICKDRRVARVLDFIAGNLPKRLSRAEAARVASLEPAYFSKRFRGAMGVSFAQWNTAIRVREAQRLLERTDFRVCEVAAAVGYDDLTTFERNFRRLLGLSPRAYRSHATTESAGTDQKTQNAERMTRVADKTTRDAEQAALSAL